MNHRPHRRRPPLHWLLACALAACAPAGDAPPPSDASAAPMPELPPGGLAIVDPQHPAHPTWVELGDIPLGEVVRYEVPLRNRERGPLVIQSIRSGCSCTIPSVYYEADDGHVLQGDLQSAGNVLTVPAGAVVKLQLEVDSKRSPTRNKPKLVVVRIVTDSPTAPFTSLDVRMRIDAPLLAEPAAIDLGRVAVHARAEGSTRRASSQTWLS